VTARLGELGRFLGMTPKSWSILARTSTPFEQMLQDFGVIPRNRPSSPRRAVTNSSRRCSVFSDRSLRSRRTLSSSSTRPSICSLMSSKQSACSRTSTTSAARCSRSSCRASGPRVAARPPGVAAAGTAGVAAAPAGTAEQRRGERTSAPACASPRRHAAESAARRD